MTWLARLFGRKRGTDRIAISQFTPVPQGGYLVGGALRDALLGRPFNDIDWLVADPEQAAKDAAARLRGSAFMLDDARDHWRVVAGGQTRDYAPLTEGLKANLRQRDFTVNAIAANNRGELIDPLNGQADLARGTLRMVSGANLAADPLRPLRGVRLATLLGFTLEPGTREAVCAHAEAQRRGQARYPAWERVGDELSRLLASDHAANGLRLLDELGLLDVYLPELAQCRGVAQGGFHHLDVLDHSVAALEQLLRGFPDAGMALRWATLLHDIGKPATKTWDAESNYHHFYGHAQLGSEQAMTLLRRLRQPTELTRQVGGLVRYHMLPLPKNRKEARRFVHRRRGLLPDLLKLMIADREAARGPLASEVNRQGYRLALSRVIEILSEPPPAKPLLNGDEVMRLLKLPPGPKVGEALRFVQEAEAVGDVRTREEAVSALRHYAARQGWLE